MLIWMHDTATEIYTAQAKSEGLLHPRIAQDSNNIKHASHTRPYDSPTRALFQSLSHYCVGRCTRHKPFSVRFIAYPNASPNAMASKTPFSQLRFPNLNPTLCTSRCVCESWSLLVRKRKTSRHWRKSSCLESVRTRSQIRVARRAMLRWHVRWWQSAGVVGQKVV